jgi:hypothetical protein
MARYLARSAHADRPVHGISLATTAALSAGHSGHVLAGLASERVVDAGGQLESVSGPVLTDDA